MNSGEGVGAVVVGGDYVGLGVARSIGRLRVPVCVLDDERSIAGHSRYVDVAARCPPFRGDDAAQALVDAADRLGLRGWVLIPTRDEIVELVARHADLLGSAYRLTTPPWDVTRYAVDKRLTYALAAEHGIPVPRTWCPSSPEEVDALDCPYPVAVKPAIKHRFVEKTKAKAWLARNVDDLRKLYERALAIVGQGEVLVQDFIPGDGREQYACCVLAAAGRIEASLVARRMRQHPSDFGRASTYVETVELPELEQLSETFVRASGLSGIAELEYKRDPRDGSFRLLDVNPRPWGYHAIGAKAGIDFSALIYEAAVRGASEPSPPRRGAPGVAWMRLLTDLPTAVVDVAASRLTMREYLRSLRRVDVEAVFSFRDPKPGLVELLLVPYLYRRRGF